VNAVAGGAHDFRHVRPDRVETGTMKPAAIARSGDRDSAGIRLVPGSEENVGLPVFVAHGQELGVDRDIQQPLGAALDAGEAGFATIQSLDRRHRVAIVRRLVPVDVVETARLDAVAATGAVLTPIDIAELAGPAEPCGHRRGMNVVAIGHINSPRPIPRAGSRWRPTIPTRRSGCECHGCQGWF